MDKANEVKNKDKPRFMIPIHPHFKQALGEEAKKERRTLTNYILSVLADKIDWQGKI